MTQVSTYYLGWFDIGIPNDSGYDKHIYILKDENGVICGGDSDDQYFIRGTAENFLDNGLDFGRLLTEANQKSEDSLDGLDNLEQSDKNWDGQPDTFIDRHYTQVSITDAQWETMVQLATDLYGIYDYNLVGANCQAVVVSMLSSVGLDFEQNVPVDSSFEDYVSRNVLLSGAGGDILRGYSYDDTIYDKHGGSDYFFGGNDLNMVRSDVSDGKDVVFYKDNYTDTLIIYDNYRVVEEGDGSTDTLYSIEKVHLENFYSSNTLDYSQFSSGIILNSKGLIDRLAESGDAKTAVYIYEKLSDAISFSAVNFGTFETTAYDDHIALFHCSGDVDGLITVDAGAGNDTISVKGSGATIYAGVGADYISAAAGSLIYTGNDTDKDTIQLVGNTYIADAGYEDRIEMLFGAVELHGAIKNAASESAWAYGSYGERYSVNTQGDLVIDTPWSSEYTYVANYESTLCGGGNTAGIYVAESEYKVWLFFQEDEGTIDEVIDTWSVLGDYSKAYTGINVLTMEDPLVIDLDGDGIELIPETYVTGQYFDLNGDGFAERTGWVSGDDGFLAIDLNGNGEIDDISELFGSPDVDGFSALAAYDTNGDGLVDANDTDFASLLIWQDSDGDAQTDDGELHTLSEIGITSFNILPTDTTSTSNSGHTVSATGEYTWSDGSTGTIGEVLFEHNLFDSQWNGEVEISADALTRPEIEGHGTLTSLQTAMSLDPTLVAVVDAACANFTTPDLSDLRDAVLPVLTGWMNAVSVPDGTPGLTTRADINLVVSSDTTGVSVDDFVIKRSDELGDYYEFASGRSIVDEQGDTISRATYEQIMSQSLNEGQEWDVLDGQAVQFAERWLGIEISIGEDSLSGQDSIDGAASTLNVIWTQLNQLVVGMATQGGALASFFEGVVYDPDTAKFTPVDNRELAPVLEEIFAAAPGTIEGDTAYLESWKEFMDVVVSNFERGGYGVLSGGYLFQNIVTAYENVGLAVSVEEAGVLFGIPEELLSSVSGTVTLSDDEDIVYISSGDDVITGGKGSDTFVIGQNFGHDVIDNYEYMLGSDDEDVVRFAHVNSTDVTATREGTDLVITVDATGDTLRLTDQFAGRIPSLTGYLEGSNGAAEIVFADGVVWDRYDMAYQVLEVDDSSSNVIGTRTADYLEGGAGDDVLHGRQDGDMYYYAQGYGNDIIDDMGTTTFDGVVANSSHSLLDAPDVLIFRNLTFDDLEFSRDESDLDNLVITLSSTGETITIIDQFWQVYGTVTGTPWINRIEGFTFTDGYMLDADEVMEIMMEEAGTDGDDTIYGFDYDDVLDGGAGDDYLSGGNDEDTYMFGLGYGQDTIFENHDQLLSADTDTVLFFSDVDYTTVTLERLDTSLDDLTIYLSDGSSLTIEKQFLYYSVGGEFEAVEYFEFQDGSDTIWDQSDIKVMLLDAASTSGDDVIYGFDTGDDILDGGAGNDTLYGLNGGDTYRFGVGSGNDTILDVAQAYAAGTDVVEFTGSLNSTGVSFSRSGSDLVITIDSSGETLTVQNQFDSLSYYKIETYSFLDADLTSLEVLTLASAGSVIEGDSSDNDPLNGTDGDDIIYGYEGDDVVYGGLGNDIIIGGAGDDTLYGDGGTNTYIFNKNDGHDFIDRQATANSSIVSFEDGILPSDIYLTRTEADKADITFEIVDSDNSITIEDFNTASDLYLIDEFLFSDGTVWDADFVKTQYFTDNTTAGDDTLIGFESDNVFLSSEGNDYLAGYGGDDVYSWSSTADNDTVFDAGSSLSVDQIVFEDLNISDLSVDIVDDSYVFTNISNGATLTVLEQAHTGSSLYQIESYAFADGTVLDDVEIAAYIPDQLIEDNDYAHMLYGSSCIDTIDANGGNDYLYGYEGDDTLIGGTGDDRLYGGEGDDTYIFNLGDGQDRIDDDAGDYDVIELGAGITWDDVVLTQNGDDLEITFTSSPDDKITVLDQYDTASTNQIEAVILDDGSVQNLVTEIPVLTNNGISTDEDTSVTLTTSMLDLTDTDTADIELTYTIQTLASEGMLYLDGVELVAGDSFTQQNLVDGLVSYTPDADVTGSDSFTVVASDGASVLPAATISITIDAVNDVPVAVDDVVETDEDTSVVFNVLTNDTDIDADTITLVSVNAPSHGAAMWSSDGTITYTPTGDYYGPDSFEYTVSDGNGGEASATVTLTINSVNDAPVAANDDFTVDYEDALSANVLTDNGYGADSDPEGDTLSVLETTITSVQGVIITMASNGDFTYAAPTSYTGEDSFTYTLSDGNGGTSVATVTLSIESNESILYGTAANDTITGTAGADVIYVGEGHDTVYGNEGDDVYYDEAGQDTFYGNDGNDTFYKTYISGDTYYDRFYGGAGTDTIDYSGYDYAVQVTLVTNGASGKTTFSSDLTGTLTTILYSYGDVENVVGSTYDDYLLGTTGNNVIEGGTGADDLYGSSGDDTYIFNLGDGLDTITDTAGTNDVIQFGAGIEQSDIVFARVADSLEITFSGNATDKITIADYYDTGSTNEVEKLVFDDASEMVIASNLPSGPIYGSSGDDTITGTAGADVIYVGEGHDTVYGNEGDDVYYDEAGQDTFYGNDGNDTFYKTYISGDTYYDRFYGGAGTDTIDYSGYDYAVQVTLLTNGASGKTTFSSDLTGTLTTILYSYGDVENVVGSTYDDYLLGTTGNNVIEGGTGADDLYGSSGDDTYIFNLGDGLDTITDTAGTNDVIQFGAGIEQSDIVFARVADSLEITFSGNATDKITIADYYDTGSTNEVEKLVFSDSSELIIADNLPIAPLLGTSGNDTITGTTDDDLIYAGEGHDTVYGDDGDDIYYDEDGQDTIYGDAGDDYFYETYTAGETWDNYHGGAGIDTIDFSGFGYAVKTLLTVNGSSCSTAFSTDLSGSLTVIARTFLDIENVVGSSYDDYLSGTTGNNVIEGGAGDDILGGYLGDDTYIYNIGNGQDTIIDTSGTNDVIQFGAGIEQSDIIFTRSVNDLEITFSGNATDKITIEEYYDTNEVEKLVFDDASEMVIASNLPSGPIYGSSANDSMIGTSGDDEIYAGAGHDTVFGNEGNDFYHDEYGQDTFYGNDGNDTFYETFTTGESWDKFYGGAGIDTIDYSGFDYAVKVVLAINGASGKTAFSTDINGTLTTIMYTYGDVENVVGSAYDDYLLGTSGSNEIEGGAGADDLYGYLGSDTFVFGDDVLDVLGNIGDLDTIKDWGTGGAQDAILIENILEGFVEGTSDIEDYIQSVNDGTDSVVQVDRDGAGTQYSWENLVEIEGTNDLDILTMYSADLLQVA